MRHCCVVPFAFAALFVSAANSQDKKAPSKVEGTFVIPKDVASFKGRLLEIRLYKYDPRIADKGADLVEKIELKDFAHTTGKETKKEFVIGAKAELEPKMGYYVTLFVLDDGKRTHRGRCDHDKNGIGKVLTDGQPSKITMEVGEIK